MFRFSKVLRRSAAPIMARRFSEDVSTKAVTQKGPITFASLGLALITGLVIVTYYKYEKEERIQNSSQKAVTYGKAAVGGPWALVDCDGVPRTNASYEGKFLLYYFGFTYCPDICPTELVKIGKIMYELEKRKEASSVVPLFISVDPGRDTLGQLKNYKQDFHPSMEFLTGTDEQVSKVAKSFRVYFTKANEDEDEDYLVDHSIVIYMIGPDGEFLDFFTQKMSAKDIVDKIIDYKKKFNEAK